MANIIIVTNHLYLLCEKIHSIHIDVNDVDRHLLRRDEPKLVKKGKKAPKKKTQPKMSLEELIERTSALNTYCININYQPVNANPNNGGDTWQTCQINVMGHKETMAIFRSIVQQIREQIPDQVFLNELVDKLLDDDDNQDA